jgi:hypothetical protein
MSSSAMATEVARTPASTTARRRKGLILDTPIRRRERLMFTDGARFLAELSLEFSNNGAEPDFSQ